MSFDEISKSSAISLDVVEAGTKNLQVRTELLKAQQNELMRQVQRALKSYYVDEKELKLEKVKKSRQEKNGKGDGKTETPGADDIDAVHVFVKQVTALTEVYNNLVENISQKKEASLMIDERAFIPHFYSKSVDLETLDDELEEIKIDSSSSPNEMVFASLDEILARYEKEQTYIHSSWALNGIYEMIYSDEYTRELNEDGKRILDEFERNTDFWHRDWSLPDDLYPPKHGEKDLERDLIDRCISSAVNNTEIEDPEPPLTLFNLDQGAAKPDEYHEAAPENPRKRQRSKKTVPVELTSESSLIDFVTPLQPVERSAIKRKLVFKAKDELHRTSALDTRGSLHIVTVGGKRPEEPNSTLLPQIEQLMNLFLQKSTVSESLFDVFLSPLVLSAEPESILRYARRLANAEPTARGFHFDTSGRYETYADPRPFFDLVAPLTILPTAIENNEDEPLAPADSHANGMEIVNERERNSVENVIADILARSRLEQRPPLNQLIAAIATRLRVLFARNRTVKFSVIFDIIYAELSPSQRVRAQSLFVALVQYSHHQNNRSGAGHLLRLTTDDDCSLEIALIGGDSADLIECEQVPVVD